MFYHDINTDETYKVIAFTDDIVLIQSNASFHFKELTKEPLDTFQT